MPRIDQKPSQRSGPVVSQGTTVPLEVTAGEDRIDLPPVPPFLLFWQPGRGCYRVGVLSDGTCLLVPRMQEIAGEAGVGWVESSADGKQLIFSKAAQHYRDSGAVVLDAATCRRHNLASYIVRHEGKLGGIHLPPWRKPVLGRDGRWTIATDEDSKIRWERELLTSGVIPLPEGADIQEIRESRERRIGRHVGAVNERDRLALEAERDAQARETKAIEGTPLEEGGVEEVLPTIQPAPAKPRRKAEQAAEVPDGGQ